MRIKEPVKTAWIIVAIGLPLAKVVDFATYSWFIAFLPVIAPVALAVSVVALAMLGHALNYVGLAPFNRNRKK